MKVFIDSDVIISSLISKTGASYLLLKQPLKKVEFVTSNHSAKEVTKVVKRMALSQSQLAVFLNKSKSVKLDDGLVKLQKDYNKYVNDINDAHIVAAAKKSNSSILLTYNHKDYKKEKIKRELDVTLMSPGQFLQYLRTTQ